MWAVFKKEVKNYFCTSIGYIYIGVFLLAFSLTFFLYIFSYSSNNYEYIFLYWPTILTFVFLVPVLTMRSFSEERKTGTEQLLLTSPISLTKIVLGKFFAAVFITLIVEAASLMYLAILCHFGKPKIPITLTTLLGFFLFMTAYISFGIFASSITENQIVAAIVTIALFVFTWLLPEFNTKLEGYSMMSMFYKYTQGQIDIANTVTFILFTLMCLALTIIVMQRRKSVK